MSRPSTADYAAGSLQRDVWNLADAKPVELTGGEDRNDVALTYPLNSLHKVQGQLQFRGIGGPASLGAVGLVARDEMNNEMEFKTLVAADGSFEMSEVPPGNYTLKTYPDVPEYPAQAGNFKAAEQDLVVQDDVRDLVVSVSR